MDQRLMEQELVPTPYIQYLQERGCSLSEDLLHQFQTHLTPTHWEDPTSAIELNNLAVMALIDAEQSEDLALRAMHVNLAVEALESAAELGGHPLCGAHLALVYAMVGDVQSAIDRAFNHLLATLHQSNWRDASLMGLVYLPPAREGNAAIARAEEFQALLQAETGDQQALLLLAIVLSHTQFVFYNSNGLRFLQFITHFFPQSSALQLQLGLSSVMNQQWEGLVYLHRARELDPDHAGVLQSLYLAHRALRQKEMAQQWLETAQQLASERSGDRSWAWTTLPLDCPFTYVPFDQRLVMAVEASIHSIVTGVLIAEADWFEQEMEFWRHQLKPGMTVIDVGANVGVYTFSAANQVGATGRVFAVEPFSQCVQCLEETRRVNQLDWVKVLAGAASDRQGTARLSLHTASELNEVVTDETVDATGQYETIQCFTLDSLIDQEQLTRVDWIKIDAEGHEMQVLNGSDRLLREFRPGILYENIAAGKASNSTVAQHLLDHGYQLFRYQPFMQELIPIDSIAALAGNLNIIALPKHP